MEVQFSTELHQRNSRKLAEAAQVGYPVFGLRCPRPAQGLGSTVALASRDCDWPSRAGRNQ